MLVAEVDRDIYQINTHEGRPYLCSTVYVVIGTPSAIIETGPTAVAPVVMEGLKEIGLRPDSVGYILPTHIHIDHAGGVGALAQRLPQAEVLIHHRGLKHFVDPSRLMEGTRQAFGDQAEQFGPILPVPESRLKPISGGEVISLGGRRLEFILAPGHAPHHLCILERKSSGLFCGEAVGMYDPPADSLSSSASPPVFDLDEALETLDKLEALRPGLLLFSHYGVGHQVKRLFQTARELFEGHGRILLEAAKAGEDYESMARRLNAYEESQGRRYPQPRDWGMVIVGYLGYFKNKKLI